MLGTFTLYYIASGFCAEVHRLSTFTNRPKDHELSQCRPCTQFPTVSLSLHNFFLNILPTIVPQISSGCQLPNTQQMHLPASLYCSLPPALTKHYKDIPKFFQTHCKKSCSHMTLFNALQIPPLNTQQW